MNAPVDFPENQNAVSGLVGQVIYSILNPAQFEASLPASERKKWALLDGRAIAGSKLAECLGGVDKLPDARGMFFRAMNFGRPDGDPDGDRPVGGYQPDELASHAHNYINSSGGPAGTAKDGPHGVAQRSAQTTATGGNETRPRNIALYVYIRID